MFNHGLKARPDREQTRQVIYYMTNSDPYVTQQLHPSKNPNFRKNNLNPLNQFKASKGVIIVNSMLAH